MKGKSASKKPAASYFCGEKFRHRQGRRLQGGRFQARWQDDEDGRRQGRLPCGPQAPQVGRLGYVVCCWLGNAAWQGCALLIAREGCLSGPGAIAPPFS